MELWQVIAVWLASGIAGGVIGWQRDAVVTGAICGLLLGPLGVVAALAIDGREQCPEFLGRLRGRAATCEHCGKSLLQHWREVEIAESSLDCPHCGTRTNHSLSECETCGYDIAAFRRKQIERVRASRPI